MCCGVYPVKMAPCAGPCWSFQPVALLFFLLLLPFLLCRADPAPHARNITELVRINVTTMHETTEVKEQVFYNLSYDRGQMLLNGYPLSKGVSRISAKINIVGDGSSYEQNLLREALVNLRVLVLQWPMNYSTGETQIIVQQEVISIAEIQATQDVTMEVKLVVSNNTGIRRYTSKAVLLKDTLLHHIPWNEDILFTFPNILQSGDSVPQDTTREYNTRQNTTLDEKPFTGELPETPLRAMIPPSSYKMMCQLVDNLRLKLCLFWKELYPVLVSLVEVFLVGVMAAALIVELLKVVYPPRQNKEILHPMDSKESILLFPLLSHNKLTLKAQEAGIIL